MSERRAHVHAQHSLSKSRRCELLSIARSSAYYRAEPVSSEDLKLMRLIDEIHLRLPFYGSRRLRDELYDQDYVINRKRIQRLMRQMGIRALYPRVRTSQPGEGHKIYPYLLRNLAITRVNQVWSTDITYVPLRSGFMYLVAVIDWFSRYVLSWRLSNTLDGQFCLDALHEALCLGKPEIFNTDQGAQFTAHAFTSALKKAEIRISMDGKGRALDNIFIERLWRTVKYEDIYLQDYETVPMLYAGLDSYFQFYNHERPHQSLDNAAPAEIHFDGQE